MGKVRVKEPFIIDAFQSPIGGQQWLELELIIKNKPFDQENNYYYYYYYYYYTIFLIVQVAKTTFQIPLQFVQSLQKHPEAYALGTQVP
jgi:hypothetical protein